MNISLFFVVCRTQRARHENDHVPDERRETEETLARACTALITKSEKKNRVRETARSHRHGVYPNE